MMVRRPGREHRRLRRRLRGITRDGDSGDNSGDPFGLIQTPIDSYWQDLSICDHIMMVRRPGREHRRLQRCLQGPTLAQVVRFG